MTRSEQQDQALTVIARSPFHVFYEGPSMTVSASNRIGRFDVLPGHADFFSVLIPEEIIIETPSDPVKFDITNGIITVRDNQVMIFVNM